MLLKLARLAGTGGLARRPFVSGSTAWAVQFLDKTSSHKGELEAGCYAGEYHPDLSVPSAGVIRMRILAA